MKRLILLICTMLCATAISAQNISVQGTVTSADDGEPLAGVTVMVKGTFSGVSTDIDGKYKITLPAGGGDFSLPIHWI